MTALNNPTRVEYLAEVCAVFIKENKDAFVEEYPLMRHLVEELTVPTAWKRTLKYDATEEEQHTHKHATTVYLYTYHNGANYVEAKVFTFGISVAGLSVTVNGK